MLITFYSNAWEHIMMFGDIAKQLITMMGHSGTVPGALTADEIPGALIRLQTSLRIHKEDAAMAHNDEHVSLKVRAVPLVNMLQASEKEHCSVRWE